MNPLFRNIIVVVLAVIAGSALNMSLVYSGSIIFPLPEGLNATTEEGLKAAIPFFEPKHFLFPFLAHALGTFATAYISTRYSSKPLLSRALILSAIFFYGGVSMVMAVPGPMWFNIADLALAYFPIGYVAWRMAKGKNSNVVD